MITAGYMIYSPLLRPEWRDHITYVSSAGDVAPLDAPDVVAAGAYYQQPYLDGRGHYSLPMSVSRQPE